MKKTILLLFTMAIAIGSYAQDDVNRWWLGGSAGFANASYKDAESISGWQLGPQAGFMLNDKMGVGLNLLFNGFTTKENDDDNSITKDNGWMVEPLFRYYFAGTGNFKFFGDAAVGFGGGKTSFDSDTFDPVENTYSNWGIRISPGAQFWFNENWSMLASIGLLGYGSRTDKYSDDSEETVNAFEFSADFDTFNLAFFWHF